MVSAIRMPSGISIDRMIAEKISLAAERIPQPVRMQHSWNHSSAGPEELVVAEGVLDRIVDHRHERDDGEKATSTNTGMTRNQALLIEVFSISGSLLRQSNFRRH
jgi:hypothetical protein